MQCTRRSIKKEDSATAFVCYFAISKKLEITNWKEKIQFTVDFCIVIENLRTSNPDNHKMIFNSLAENFRVVA